MGLSYTRIPPKPTCYSSFRPKVEVSSKMLNQTRQPLLTQAASECQTEFRAVSFSTLAPWAAKYVACGRETDDQTLINCRMFFFCVCAPARR